MVDLAAPADLDFEPLGEGIDHTDTDTMEPTRDLVRALVELITCVQDGHREFDIWDLLYRVDIDGDITTIVSNGDRLIGVDRDGDIGTEDRKSTRLNSSHVAIAYAVFCLK